MTKRLDGPSDAAKMRVMRRDRYTCAYCGAEGKDVELQIDHIVPVAKGGSHHISNLVTACMACNQSKGASLDYQPANSRKGIDDMNGNGFSGLFVHTLKNGRIHNQGQIIRKDGELYAIQLFSFFDGSPTNVRLVTSDFLVNECRLYATQEQWIRAHLKEMEQDGTLSGGVEANLEMIIGQKQKEEN